MALPQLLQMKEVIEAEIGEKLERDPNPENLDKTIGLKRDADLTKRDNWDEYLDWLTEFLKTQKNCPAEYVGTELSLKRERASLRVDVLDVSKGKLLYSKEEYLQEGQIIWKRNVYIMVTTHP